jgi:hypothetical protein
MRRAGCLENFHILPHYVVRSYWIPGSYAPALSEKRNAF